MIHISETLVIIVKKGYEEIKEPIEGPGFLGFILMLLLGSPILVATALLALLIAAMPGIWVWLGLLALGIPGVDSDWAWIFVLLLSGAFFAGIYLVVDEIHKAVDWYFGLAICLLGISLLVCATMALSHL